MKLHLGCGDALLPEFLNIDLMEPAGLNPMLLDSPRFLKFDLDRAELRLPFEDNSVEGIYGCHFLEHVRHILPLMGELHRVSAPGARAVFRTPYGSSDDAWEDPTHVRAFTRGSWAYFAQPTYWRADYGYRGDWAVRRIVLSVWKEHCGSGNAEAIWRMVSAMRNLVAEVECELECIKPIRARRRELMDAPEVEIRQAVQSS